MFGSVLILPVHDEAIVSSPDELAPFAAKRVSEIMVECLSEFCPKLAPIIKAEAALMKVWSKSAEPVFDDAGNLMVWAP